jgi:hypothetical protein
MTHPNTRMNTPANSEAVERIPVLDLRTCKADGMATIFDDIGTPLRHHDICTSPAVRYCSDFGIRAVIYRSCK